MSNSISDFSDHINNIYLYNYFKFLLEYIILKYNWPIKKYKNKMNIFKDLEIGICLCGGGGG